MAHWQLQRKWTCSTEFGETVKLTSKELTGHRALCLLGSAGLGKTYEISSLVREERAARLDVREKRLALLVEHGGGLAAGLHELSRNATPETAIWLDGLDEAMIPQPTAALALGAWIRDSLKSARPRLRIACRSAVFPPEILAALRAVYEEDGAVKVAVLDPLGNLDIALAAQAEDHDTIKFLAAIEDLNVQSLAQSPLTLKMLLRAFSEGNMPRDRSRLFEQGMNSLATERDERRSVGTNVKVDPATIVRTGEYIACFALLSGRESIDLGDDPQAGHLSLTEITGVPGPPGLLSLENVGALGASGLCEGAGLRTFRFAHRQYAEYLAARAIGRLPLYQARSLLESGLGWKHGVAGPLRETAAFAAILNEDIAAWISTYDPAVIGLSCVANESLRRQALLALLDKFRRQELTSAQVRWGAPEHSGLRYAKADEDLRPVICDHAPERVDVMDIALELAREWKLSSLSSDLADLVLDVDAPRQSRITAGYALAEVGTEEDKRRLKPLLHAQEADEEWQLRGIVLRCCWPHSLTTTELLPFLGRRGNRRMSGAYEGFLSVDLDKFRADGFRSAGLDWAIAHYDRGQEYDALVRIGIRIAHAAVDELDDPDILHRLTAFMLHASRHFLPPPLQALKPYYSEHGGQPPADPLADKPDTRHRLLLSIVSTAVKDDHLFWLADHTPHLVEPADFEWLLQQALREDLTMSAREWCARLARMVFPLERRAGEAWLAAREKEPIRSILNYPLEVRLDSEEANRDRKQWMTNRRLGKPVARELLDPPPSQHVQEYLRRCETDDVGHFGWLCQAMAFKIDDPYPVHTRFIMEMPGWQEATPETRTRIVRAAKHLLDKDLKYPEHAENAPLTRTLVGGIEALWLIAAQDFDWLRASPASWWGRWCWFILRELHAGSTDESLQLKSSLLALLWSNAPGTCRRRMLSLACGDVDESRYLMQSLLRMPEFPPDNALDDELLEAIAEARVPADRLDDVATFVLRRKTTEASRVCATRLEAMIHAKPRVSEAQITHLSLPLLHEGDLEAWDTVIDLIRSDRTLQRGVLGAYAQSHMLRKKEGIAEGGTDLGARRIAVLTRHLFDVFLPESDPQSSMSYGRNEAGVELRDHLLNMLRERADEESVAALKQLESDLGGSNPWLRHHRAIAQEALRQRRWYPVAPAKVANILTAAGKQLVRSTQDLLDGVLAALLLFEHALHRASPPTIGRLWDTANIDSPTPKRENHCSDELCTAIRSHFANYAVVANREVEVRHRQVPVALGGDPGSEPDIVVTVPSTGTVQGVMHELPIEVKLSDNIQARTHLKSQLVDRYIKELGADAGLFVVLWMDSPGMPSDNKPKWATIEAAREDLDQQARMASASSLVQVAAVVIDCSRH